MFIPNFRKGISVIGIIAAIGASWLIHHWPELMAGKKNDLPPTVMAAPAAVVPDAVPVIPISSPAPRTRGYND